MNFHDSVISYFSKLVHFCISVAHLLFRVLIIFLQKNSMVLARFKAPEFFYSTAKYEALTIMVFGQNNHTSTNLIIILGFLLEIFNKSFTNQFNPLLHTV